MQSDVNNANSCSYTYLENIPEMVYRGASLGD